MNEHDFDKATRFPLTWESHVTGWHILFDLAVVGRSLGCVPGDLILDYACGPGYVSEILNRFGYHTVALDKDPEAIEVAKARFRRDRRLDEGRARFVIADAESMPFPDSTFDGVVCMNSFHHMPDYGRALSEIYRVLKPGCRAVFSEPGSIHSATRLSAVMIEQFGYIEKDIVIDQIFDLAIKAGFAKVFIKPFVYPELLTVGRDEWARIKRGDTAGTELDVKRICHIIEETHPIFILEKAGAKRTTSANPNILKARIDIKGFKFIPGRSSFIDIHSVVKNEGDTIWLSEHREFGGHITLGVKVLDSTGRFLGEGKNRLSLPHDINPGEEVTLSGKIELGSLSQGEYTLRIDLVDEFICWFEEHHQGYSDIKVTV